MNKERLNELKRKINGIAGKSDLAYQDECDLDDLIDAELSRQSVTDDMEKAISFLMDLGESCAYEWRLAEGKHIGGDLSTGETHLRTAIAALSALRRMKGSESNA